MAIPVNGSGVESSSSAIRLTAVQDAIRSRNFAELANIIDTLELEVRGAPRLRVSSWSCSLRDRV